MKRGLTEQSPLHAAYNLVRVYDELRNQDAMLSLSGHALTLHFLVQGEMLRLLAGLIPGEMTSFDRRHLSDANEAIQAVAIDLAERRGYRSGVGDEAGTSTVEDTARALCEPVEPAYVLQLIGQQIGCNLPADVTTALEALRKTPAGAS